MERLLKTVLGFVLGVLASFALTGFTYLMLQSMFFLKDQLGGAEAAFLVMFGVVCGISGAIAAWERN